MKIIDDLNLPVSNASIRMVILSKEYFGISDENGFFKTKISWSDVGMPLHTFINISAYYEKFRYNISKKIIFGPQYIDILCFKIPDEITPYGENNIIMKVVDENNIPISNVSVETEILIGDKSWKYYAITNEKGIVDLKISSKDFSIFGEGILRISARYFNLSRTLSFKILIRKKEDQSFLRFITYIILLVNVAILLYLFLGKRGTEREYRVLRDLLSNYLYFSQFISN